MFEVRSKFESPIGVTFLKQHVFNLCWNLESDKDEVVEFIRNQRFQNRVALLAPALPWSEIVKHCVV